MLARRTGITQIIISFCELKRKKERKYRVLWKHKTDRSWLQGLRESVSEKVLFKLRSEVRLSIS